MRLCCLTIPLVCYATAVQLQFGSGDRLGLTCTATLSVDTQGQVQVVDSCNSDLQHISVSQNGYDREFVLMLSQWPENVTMAAVQPHCFRQISSACVVGTPENCSRISISYTNADLAKCYFPPGSAGIGVQVQYWRNSLGMVAGTIAVSRKADVDNNATIRVASIQWPNFASNLNVTASRDPSRGPSYDPEIAGFTSCDGGFLLDASVAQLQFSERIYPGQCPMQFMTHHSGQRGIMAASLDTAGEVKTMTLAVGPGAKQQVGQGRSAALALGLSVPDATPPSALLSFTHMRPEVPLEPGQSMSLPYAVGLAVYQGPEAGQDTLQEPLQIQPNSTGLKSAAGIRLSPSWQDAAALYRDWSESAGVLNGTSTLLQRQDVPGFLKQGALGLISAIQLEGGFNPSKFGPHLEELPGYMQQYKANLSVATGMQGGPPVFTIPYGWEKDGVWAGIFYLPPLPSAEDWMSVVDSLRGHGDGVGFLVSGYWWVVKREASGGGPAFDHSSLVPQLSDMLVTTRNGTLFEVDCYGVPNCGQAWRGLSHKLCHGQANASRTMVDILTSVNGNLRNALAGHAPGFSGSPSASSTGGVPLVSFDQEIGAGQAHPCYNESHGHPPGFGRWMWEGIRDVVDEVKEQAAAAGRPVGLLSEQCSELMASRFASFWSRQFGEVGWGLGMGRAVGGFSFVHHERVTAMAAALVQGQGQGGGSRPGVPVRAKVIANAVARGLLPVPFDADVHPGPLHGQTAWTKEVSRAFFSLAGALPQFAAYLARGRAMRNPRVDGPTIRSTVPARGSNGTATQKEWSFPALSVGTFRRDDSGDVAVVLASADGNSTSNATVWVAESAGAWARDLRAPGVLVEEQPQHTLAHLAADAAAGCSVSLVDLKGRQVRSWESLPTAANVTVPAYSVRVLMVDGACLPGSR